MRDSILFTRLLISKETEITYIQGSRCLLSLLTYIQIVCLFVKKKILELSDVTRLDTDFAGQPPQSKKTGPTPHRHRPPRPSVSSKT